MSFLAALLALAQGFGGAGMPGDPGPVVLLGSSAEAREVPELAERWEARVRIRIGSADEADSAPPGAIVLARERRHAADDPRSVRLVRAARAIEIEPGPLLDWFAALYPGKHETELVRAIREAHRAGCAVAGRGESVALLSAASVVPDSRDIGRVERDPHDVGRPAVVWGLGLQPWAVADEASRSGGSLERLLVLLEEDRMRLALWIGERSAVVVDRAADAFVARGAGISAVLDPRGARSGEGSLRGVGMSLLGPGDRWIRRQRTAEIDQAGAPDLSRSRQDLEVERAEPLDPATLLDALAELEDPLPGTLVVRSGESSVRIELGSNVRARRGTNERAAGWSGLVTSFSWPASRAGSEALRR